MIISLNHTVWKYEIKESYHWIKFLCRCICCQYCHTHIFAQSSCLLYHCKGIFERTFWISFSWKAMPSWSREFNLQAQMIQLDETVLLPTKDGFENNIYATESPSASRTPWTIASKNTGTKINSYQKFHKNCLVISFGLWDSYQISRNASNVFQIHPKSVAFWKHIDG